MEFTVLPFTCDAQEALLENLNHYHMEEVNGKRVFTYQMKQLSVQLAPAPPSLACA